MARAPSNTNRALYRVVPSSLTSPSVCQDQAQWRTYDVARIVIPASPILLSTRPHHLSQDQYKYTYSRIIALHQAIYTSLTYKYQLNFHPSHHSQSLIMSDTGRESITDKTKAAIVVRLQTCMHSLLCSLTPLHSPTPRSRPLSILATRSRATPTLPRPPLSLRARSRTRRR